MRAAAEHAIAVATAEQRRLSAARIFIEQPWRLRRIILTLLRQRFVHEPFILRYFRFRLARCAARRIRLVRTRLRLLWRLNFMQRIPFP